MRAVGFSDMGAGAYWRFHLWNTALRTVADWIDRAGSVVVRALALPGDVLTGALMAGAGVRPEAERRDGPLGVGAAADILIAYGLDRMYASRDGEAPDRAVRWAAAEALGEMGKAAATPEVVGALLGRLRDGDEDPFVRSAAARALGRMGPRAATPEVLRALVECLGPEEVKP